MPILFKLDEWAEDLMRTEMAAFTARKYPPEIDADGLYTTSGTVIFLNMVSQQVDLVLGSDQGPQVLASVVDEVTRVMRSSQRRWTALLDSEYRQHKEYAKHTAERPKEVGRVTRSVQKRWVKRNDTEKPAE